MQDKQETTSGFKLSTYISPIDCGDVYDKILHLMSDDHKNRYGLWLEENEPHFWMWSTRLLFSKRPYQEIARVIERLLDIYVK